jgi:hypothetical protein
MAARTLVIGTLYIHRYIIRTSVHYTYIGTLYVHRYVIRTSEHYTYIGTLYVHWYIKRTLPAVFRIVFVSHSKWKLIY